MVATPPAARQTDGLHRGEFNDGSGYSVSLSGDDEATLRRYWDALSDGGTITMPFEKAPWGDTFGMLTDKFGVNWLVNANGAPPS